MIALDPEMAWLDLDVFLFVAESLNCVTCETHHTLDEPLIWILWTNEADNVATLD